MALSKEEVLKPALLKLDRAELHINDLERVVTDFLAEKPYSLVIRQDPNLGKGTLSIKQHKPVPETLPLILGDALHNTRSALDLLAVGLVGVRAIKPWEVQFPFTRQKANVRSQIIQRQFHLVSDELADAVEALEPYPGGKNGLYELHALDISDKHKIILVGHRAAHVTGDQLGTMGFQMTGPGVIMFTGDGDDMIAFNAPRASRMARRASKDGIPIAEHSPPFDGKFTLCFGNNEPFGGSDVVTRSRDLTEKVKGICGDLASVACP
ncbi:MAG: hypothetical protein ACOH1H_11495 [Brevundimonas sp.]